MHMNLVTMTDSYKVTHWRQYPPKTEYVYSYFESRGGKFEEIVFFGLQYYLQEYLSKPITAENISAAEALWTPHLGDKSLFNKAGWAHILTEHGGYLPLRIRAVPEGMVVPTHNVLMTVENTDPKVPWLTNWVETLLSQIWYGCTVATLSREMKRMMLDSLKRTGDPALIDFKLHDFGFRGVSSVESAAMGGCAHLVNFKGTDTAKALEFASQYYKEPMAGFSIPAAEHSTITSWGREHEVDAYQNMIDQFGSGGAGMYAVVSDSYDIFNACTNLWGGVLKEAVLAAPNTLIVRPDSGLPRQMVPDVLAALASVFGTTTNAKGYKVLNKVRVIQGDGIDYEETRRIIDAVEIAGFSLDNVAFGMGGALLQKLNRDTQKFAFKCSSIVIDGETHDVYKEPVTDPGKNSKRGRLRLIQGEHGLETVAANHWIPGKDLLETVYESDGENRQMLRYTLAEVRARAAL